MSAGAIASALVACASSPPPAPAPPPPQPAPQCNAFETIDLELSPDPRLNPDREGYARSAVVRIYQLEGSEAFERASFDELWRDTSGGSAARSVVSGPDELVIIPGQLDKRALLRNPKATHVGVAVNFREHQELFGWKVAAPIAPANPCPSKADPVAAHLGMELQNYVIRLR
ncbi:MAG TPA: type VI secretion system lipoprotein TssJ [Polyangiales bacterium]